MKTEKQIQSPFSAMGEAFRSSALEFKKIRTLAACAMLIALNIILDSFSIPVGNLLRIGISFITIALAGMLYGPIASMACAALSDILCAILIPRGAYFPGWTLGALVGGLIYGLVLYGKKVTYLRALLAKGLVNLFVNILLGTLWLSVMYGNAFIAIVGMRIAKNAGALALEAAMIFFVGNLAQEVLRRMKKSPVKT
ncbi:MAG: folate family ECF transporter S component [Christensenellales bacterium]